MGDYVGHPERRAGSGGILEGKTGREKDRKRLNAWVAGLSFVRVR